MRPRVRVVIQSHPRTHLTYGILSFRLKSLRRVLLCVLGPDHLGTGLNSCCLSVTVGLTQQGSVVL